MKPGSLNPILGVVVCLCASDIFLLEGRQDWSADILVRFPGPVNPVADKNVRAPEKSQMRKVCL